MPEFLYGYLIRKEKKCHLVLEGAEKEAGAEVFVGEEV
jgi:hypothetical protein